MSDCDCFPPQLLEQPRSVRLNYFVAKLVAHPHLTQAYEALKQAIHQPTSTSLIFVFGPVGVGKTTLRRRIEKLLIQEAMPILESDPARLPVVGLEALAPDSGSFNWKDYYTRALLACDEPLVDRKIDCSFAELRSDQQRQLLVREDTSAAKLRRAWEQCLRHRRPTAVIIDEAQHLQKVTSGRRLLDQMDVIKSLASLTQTIHVLIGTYELLNLLRLSAQLSRRSIEIHFPRYRPDQEQDIQAFNNILWTFQRHLPLAKEADLIGHYDYFYERSAGCIGLLKDWLNRALDAALQDGQETLTHTYLERHAYPFPQLKRIALDIKEGEEALRQVPYQQDELRTLLGMDPASPPDKMPHPTKSRSTRSAFQRNPVRDPIGVPDHVQ
jgi:energy-coupling factor transporter ATP-binding protein EcfA2